MTGHGPLLRMAIACTLAACGRSPAADEKKAAPAEEVAAPAEEPYATTRAMARELAQELVQRDRARGLSIALIEGPDVVWADGYGVVEPGGRAVTPQTPFRAGSLAKPLLAVAVMQEVEKETWSLDDPLQEYVDFSIQSRFASARPITIRDVLTHRSGLPAEDLRFAWSGQPRDWHELAPGLAGESMAAPPGRVLSYSNVAFALLGHAFERVTETDFDSAMQVRVLKPLRMFASTFGPAPDHRAKPVPPDLQPGLVPATGLSTTAMDLAYFVSMLLSKGKRARVLLSEDSVAELLRVQNADSVYDFRTRVGLGFKRSHRRLDRLGEVAWHDGQVPGYQAQMILMPQHELGLVVLATSQDAPAIEEFAIAVLEHAIGDKGSQASANPPALAPLEPVTDVTGLYAAQGGVISVAVDADRLRIDDWTALAPGLLEGEPAGGLRRAGSGVFAGSNLELAFARVDEHVVLVGTRDGVRGRLAERFEPRPLPPPWRERAGKWEAESADPWTGRSDVELVADEGFLRLRFSSAWGDGARTEWALVPIDPETAVIAGLGRGKGETIAVERRDDRELLRWQGIRLQRAGD